jgi:uncharacterized protein
VNYLDRYTIPFWGLKPGVHAFDFEIDHLFFDRFEHSEIKSGNLTVHVDMEREERMLVLDFMIHGQVDLPCDRCLEPVSMIINGIEKLVVKLGDHFEEESDLVIMIQETEKVLDISSFIYEFVHLLLPARRIHPENEKGESTCSPEVLNKLRELSEQHVPDPRWDALNKIKEDIL